jgi:predicted RNase H-like nuclease (RuvC/YqgF family)
MASIHNRKLIAALSRELKQKDVEIQELRQTVSSFENMLNDKTGLVSHMIKVQVFRHLVFRIIRNVNALS